MRTLKKIPKNVGKLFVILRVFVSSWWIWPGVYHEDAKTQRIAKFWLRLGCNVFICGFIFQQFTRCPPHCMLAASVIFLGIVRYVPMGSRCPL